LLIVPVDEIWKATEADVRGIGESTTGKIKIGLQGTQRHL
jgi:hypothetical protein